MGKSRRKLDPQVQERLGVVAAKPVVRRPVGEPRQPEMADADFEEHVLRNMDFAQRNQLR